MAKINIKSKKKSKNRKTKKQKKVIKAIDTVIPISTPAGSVHFDEFLKICREPKLIQNTIETAKKTKKSTKGEKSKKSKKSKKTKKITKTKKTKKSKIIGISKVKVVVKPNDIPPPPQPTLFPLIKALLLPSDDDTLDENTLFSVSCLKSMKSHDIKMLYYRNLLSVNPKHS